MAIQGSAAVRVNTPSIYLEITFGDIPLKVINSTQLIGSYHLLENISKVNSIDGVYKCKYTAPDGRQQWLAAKLGDFERQRHEQRIMNTIQTAGIIKDKDTGFIKCYGGCTVKLLRNQGGLPEQGGVSESESEEEEENIEDYSYISFYELFGPSILTLSAMIKARRFNIPRGLEPSLIQRITKQIFKTLQRTHHECDIIHNDIKPDNVAYDIQTKCIKMFDTNNSCRMGKYMHVVPPTWAYRPTWLALGSPFRDLVKNQQMYEAGINIWSTLCMLAEAYLGAPFITYSSKLSLPDEIEIQQASSDPDSDDEEFKHLPKSIEPLFPKSHGQKTEYKFFKKINLIQLSKQNHILLLQMIKVLGFPQPMSLQDIALQTLCNRFPHFKHEVDKLKQQKPLGLGSPKKYMGEEGKLEMQLRDLLTQGLRWGRPLTLQDVMDHPFLKNAEPDESASGDFAAASKS